MARRRSAELVFVESPRGGSWAGWFVNQPQVLDRVDGSNGPLEAGRRLRFVARIVDHSDELERRQRELDASVGWGRRDARVGISSARRPFEVTTQGSHPSSRRYSSWPTLAAAQAYLSKWASRRFAYATPEDLLNA